MKSQLFKTFLFLVSLPYFTLAQSSFSGIVLDKATLKPIPGVNITDVNTGKGTITNEEGEFLFFSTKGNSKVQVSHIAYKKQEIEISKAEKVKILLEVAAIQLPEFQTGNPAITILNAVIRKSVSDSSNKHYYKAFYQKVSYFNGKYTKFQQLFTNVVWSQLGVERWQPLNVRYGQFEKQRHYGQNMIVVPFMYSSVFKKHINFPLNAIDISSNYNFSIKHYLNIGTPDELVVINCKPSKSNKNLVKFEGEFVINSQKDLLMRIQGKYTHKTQKGLHHYQDVYINFKENKSGYSVFDHLLISDKTNRALQKYKNEDKIWFYFIKETTEFDLKKSELAFILKDIKIINETAYNPEFWRQNLPIKQTKIEEEIIKYFEKRGEFKSNF